MRNLRDDIRNAISKGLPGTDVQWIMASSDRLVKDFPRFPGKDAREAAVLILLYPDRRSVHTAFIQRPVYEGIHSGQIAFPGGKKESSDKDLIHTALREAEEEIGIDPGKIEILGTLTPLFIPVSNIVVTPVAGWSEEKPRFNHAPEEVVYLIPAELERFLEPSMVKIKPYEIRGQLFDVKYFDYEDHMIWGATAMILNELLAIIKRDNIHLRISSPG